MNIKIKRIEIKCEDNFKYTQIAFLVDRADFLADVQNYRRKWLKDDEPIPYEKYLEWYDNLTKSSREQEKVVSQQLQAIKSELKEAAILIWERRFEEARPILQKKERIERTVPITDYICDLQYFALKYHVPETFFGVLGQAVICGRVTEEDWKSCYAVLQPAHFRPEYLIDNREIQEPECTFIITPYTTEKELLQLLRQEKSSIDVLYKKAGFRIDLHAKDTISNIKRDRDWYWKHKSGLSYQAIWNQTPKKERPATRQGVIEAIKQYEHRLAVKI